MAQNSNDQAADASIEEKEILATDYALRFDQNWLQEATTACNSIFGIQIDSQNQEFREHPFLLLAIDQAISIHKMELKQNESLRVQEEMKVLLSEIRDELSSIKTSIDTSGSAIAGAINSRFGYYSS